MKLNVRVVPNAKHNKIVKETDRYKVYLTALAVEGKANKMLIEFLAKHFSVKKRQVKIIKGEKSRNKIVEVNK